MNKINWMERCMTAEGKLERLHVMVSALTVENGYLKKINRVQERIKLIEKATAAAHMLTGWHLAGWRTGRDSCNAYGMTDSFYFPGRALLILAGVYDEAAGWLTDDGNLILIRVERATKTARQYIKQLVHYIPNSRRPKAYQEPFKQPRFGRA